MAAHLKPRLSEAESGVFPILEETNHTEVSQEHGALYSPLHFSISKVGPNYLVVTRALWLAEPSAVSIQEAPRSTYIGCDPGNDVEVHSHVLPIMS